MRTVCVEDNAWRRGISISITLALSIGIFGAGDFLLRVVDGICKIVLALKS